jgi:hypothetical protein
VSFLEPFQKLDDGVVVRRELDRTIPGNDRNQILRQQSIPNEVNRPVDTTCRRLQPSAAKDDQKYSSVRCVQAIGSLHPHDRPVRRDRRRRCKRLRREEANLLAHAVLGDGEVLQRQIRDSLA